MEREEENARRVKDENPPNQFSLPEIDPTGAVKALTAYRPPEMKVENAVKGITAYASSAGSMASRMKVPMGRMKVLA